MDTGLYFWVTDHQKDDSNKNSQISAAKPEPLHVDDIANSRNGLILTANQRQTRYLAESFDTVDLPIRRPLITTYPHWLSNLWFELQDQAHPLAKSALSNPTQERYIWQQIVDNCPYTPPLIDNNSLSKHVQDAYRIMLNFKIPEDFSSQSPGLGTNDEETQFLSACLSDYKDRLEALKFCSSEQLPRNIQQAFKHSTVKPYDVVYLYGFAEIPPEMQSLLAELSNTQLEIHLKTSSNIEDRLASEVCYRFDDLDAELSAASQWAYKTAQEHPNSKIAIVAPNLTSVKPQLESALLKAFDPDYFLSNERFETNKYFDISASEPLINIPLVDAIFTLMKLREPVLDKDNCRKICASLFWGHHNIEVTASLLSWVNAYSSPKIPTDLFNKQWAFIESKQLSSVTKNTTNKPSPIEQDDLFKLDIPKDHYDDSTDEKAAKEAYNQAHKLSEFRESLRLVKTQTGKSASFGQSSAYKSFSDWLDWLLVNLKNIGWPGRRVPNTYEYQQLQSFFSAIEVLRTLDQCQADDSPTGGGKSKTTHTGNRKPQTRSFSKVPLSTFLRELTSVCTNMAFHMQTKDTAVSVLGLMEASALPFDFCWVVGMSDDVLPSAPKPNPFIPLQLQREYQTPRSTPQREFEYASAFVRDLESYCQNLVFSYTQNDAAAHVNKSPLLEHILDSSVPETLLSHDLISRHYESAYSYSDFEIIHTGAAPEIHEGETVPGGSAHISLYGVNPLFAFLRYRLFAKSALPESIGYTAIERGQLVHNILETIYQTHDSRTGIQSWMSTESFDEELDSIIQKSLTGIQKSTKKSVSPVLFRMEKRYQKKQVIQFLTLEIERDDFNVIETETTKTLDIAKRQVNLRIDRVDQIENQYSIIFDYKTGSVNLSDLQTEPLFDCQLPLYTLIELTKPIGAVAYAELSKKNLGYCGIGQCAPTANVNSESINSMDTTYQVSLTGITDPKILTRKNLPNTWSDTLQWWREQLVQTVSHISAGHCSYLNRNNSKSIYQSDLLFAVRPEEIMNHTKASWNNSLDNEYDLQEQH